MKKELAKFKTDNILDRRGRAIVLNRYKRLNEMKKGGEVNPKEYNLGGLIPLVGNTVTNLLNGVNNTPGPTSNNSSNGGLNLKNLSKYLPTGLNALGIVGSAINNFRKPEIDTPIQAQTGAGDRLVSNTGIDPQSLLNRNQASFSSANAQVRNGASNFSQYLNRLGANSSRLASANSQAVTGAKQYNDQVAMQRAGREDQKALNEQREAIRVDTNNAQNRAMSQDAMQAMFNQFTNIANGLDKKRYLEQQMTNMRENEQKQFLLNIATLSLKNPNVGVNSNIQSIIDNIDSMSIEDIKNNLLTFNS